VRDSRRGRRLPWTCDHHASRRFDGGCGDALAACADLDWQGFHAAHIRGTEPLPLDRVLSLAGLRLDGGTDTVLVDPAATDAAKAVRRNLVSGRR
jgi:hypothetical protein